MLYLFNLPPWLCFRVSTAGLLSVLSVLYPQHNFFFLAMMILDVGGHWCHVYR